MDEWEFAKLFFGKNKVPGGLRRIKKWIDAHDIQIDKRNYTGTEPDSWHFTMWRSGYHLIYISDDDRLYSLDLGALAFNIRNADASDFNSGKGWACEYYYLVDKMVKTFGFINWMEVSPFDTK